MCPGEEVPHFDRREDLPEAHQRHDGGEQRRVTRRITARGEMLCSFFNLDELFEQEFLHISEPDLVYVDGPPHSPCPSSASFSSSHLPSPELYPVRLQEVNLKQNPRL